MKQSIAFNPEHEQIRQLSERIVNAQSGIRILDAIQWDESIRIDFLTHHGTQLPSVDAAYYQNRPLRFDADATLAEFRHIIRAVKNQLGNYSSISKIMVRLCEEYCQAIQMLKARGTPLFSVLSDELYGTPNDVFYPGGPKQSDLGCLLGASLESLNRDSQMMHPEDEKRYSAWEAMAIVQERLSHYFGMTRVVVEVSDRMVADAAAGADRMRFNSRVRFSERDLRCLEVHEGWVHIGTTLNGLEQPICTFLSKGSPGSSTTQEGLAILTEIMTFSSYPARMLRITNRVRALQLVSDGADFLEIFRFFCAQGFHENESYDYSMRVFRGSTPQGGAFTKDLSYTKGFVLVYNYIQIALQKGLLSLIPTFFVGKTFIEDIHILHELQEQKIVVPPRYVPFLFRDLAPLSAWMGFSTFLNQFDLKAVAQYYNYLF